jgi:hypothetical protein
VDKFMAISYITTEIQYFPKMTHTQGSQDGDFIDLQVFIVV